MHVYIRHINFLVNHRSIQQQKLLKEGRKMNNGNQIPLLLLPRFLNLTPSLHPKKKRKEKRVMAAAASPFRTGLWKDH